MTIKFSFLELNSTDKDLLTETKAISFSILKEKTWIGLFFSYSFTHQESKP